ncbi:MAG: hypothetical protein U9R15_05690 [Chloroflexota bacterium]|nr:hypothetical protein [Chloroflexota bacterium]
MIQAIPFNLALLVIPTGTDNSVQIYERKTYYEQIWELFERIRGWLWDTNRPYRVTLH